MPDYAIVDSQFVENNPKYLKACTAMDAYCHAIESYWAVKSTKESRKYARQAIELCRDNIVQYVNSDDKIASDNMMLASHIAGKAINISRTTVAHALSYKMTSEYGIPHGHAVALSIAKLIEQNAKECKLAKEIYNILGFKNPVKYFDDLFKSIGIETSLEKLGIDDVKIIADSVNIERLKNNPLLPTIDELLNILRRS